jgi:hypothetical protein
VGPKAYPIFGALFKKKYKIRYETEYLFRMRKEITPNYKFKNAGKYPKHHKIQKNNIYFYQLTA